METLLTLQRKVCLFVSTLLRHSIIVYEMVFFFCSMSKLDCELQVLNETSLWWFNQTQHITQNAVVSAPDKNVTIAKKCSVFPVEFVGEL